MQQKHNEKTEHFEIPRNLQVFDDPKTHAKTIALPFQFSDGVSGILMISRLHKMAWRPDELIESITIKYK